MANLNIDPSTYVMKFGKYKNMLALDVVELQTVNRKGETENSGLEYLEFICKQDWFRHTSIVQSIIADSLEEQNVDMGDIEQKEDEPPKEPKAKVKMRELSVSHD